MSERWVDVSHEALIRGWPRLRRWIEENRAGLRVHRRLTEAALEWDRMGRDHGALYRGVRLAQAAEWRQANEASLNDLERAFLDASAALERYEIESRERLRRRVIGGLSVALAIFIALTVLAFWQWRQAEWRGQIALARQLAAQADLLRDDPDMLSRRLALAAEAMRRLHAVGANSLEVDATLRRELDLSPRHVRRFPVAVQGEVRDIGLSPDGRFVIGGNYFEGTASVWEIATGDELVHIETRVREVTATRLGQESVRMQTEGPGGSSQIKALSPEGRYLVTVNGDGNVESVQVWEVAQGRELLRLDISGRGDYALSNDGRYLAASTSTYDQATNRWSEAITRVWDAKARQEVPGSVPGNIRGFSEDATMFATSRGLWQIGGGLQEKLASDKRTEETVISLDGRYVAVVPDGEGDIEVLSTETRQKIASIPGVKGFLRALSPNGIVILSSVGPNDEIQMRNISMGVSPEAILSHTLLPSGPVAAVVTPSGRGLIATSSLDGDAVDVWELKPRGGAVFAADQDGTVLTAGLTPQGRLTTIAEIGTPVARTWDITTGQEKRDLAIEIASTVAAFAPDGISFAAAGEDGVEVRKMGEPQTVTKLAWPGARAVTWSPDGQYLAAAQEKEARVWDLSSPRSINSIPLPGPLTALALSRGGELLAAMVGSGEVTRAGEVHTAKLWNVAAPRKEPNSFEPDQGESIRRDIHCALDTRYLVTEDLKVFDMKSGAAVFQLGLNERATACALSTDGRYLATATADGVRVWDLESRKKTFQIPTDDRPLAFDQDSRYLATVSQANTVRVWSLWQDDLIAEACRRLPRNLSKEEWSLYLEEEPYHKTCPKLPESAQ